ncbi:MAG: 30S ribosomal protein S12 methylthiotransferase RimO [Ignavibacteriaceae bacterium]|nr:30S ribosomal protein S12 methylthiotransferase RimO [Ignavibacteriaceae bacterium]
MNKKKRETVSLITLGCSKNTVDSERLLRQMQLNKIKLSSNPDEADTLIINTCGFIEAAKKESINTILNAVSMKNSGKLKKVIVAGCLSERYKSDLEKEIPEVDVYFGTENYEGILKELGAELKYNLLGERLLTTPSHTAYLKISEGCDHPCSFCAIPLMRGLHKSKSIEELIREAEFLASNNTRELVLIAQDTTDYGKDLYHKKSLALLLNKLSEIEKIKWLRLMYAYPSRFPDDVIDVMADNPKVCKYIDIPLQHISDNVLKSMRRGTSSNQIKDLLFKLRERIPGLVIRTTFIVGYPNESEKDFELLYNFVKEFRFERFGVFTYSLEENTSVFEMGDPIPEKVKSERKNKLMEAQQEISAEINESLIGQQLEVLIESSENDFYIGRSYRDAPEVDGEVLISKSGGKLNAGEFYHINIYDSNEYDLFGSLNRKIYNE